MATSRRSTLAARELLRDGPNPLHVQISGLIRDRITSGSWPANYQLHAEPRLAEELRVSRGTIRRAISTLIEEGLLIQVQGKGTFVRPAKAEPPIAQELISLSVALEREGISLTTEVLEQRLVSVPTHVRGLLDLEEGDVVFRVVRRRGDGSGWTALFDNYVRRDLCPGIERADLDRRKLFEVIETDHGMTLDSARRSFQAIAADERVAEALACPVGAPVLHLEQVTYVEQAQPIEYSDVWILGDKLRLSSFLHRRTEDSDTAATGRAL